MPRSWSSLLLGTLCASGLASPLPSSTPPPPTVHLPDSDVWFTGTAANQTESFRNIRFGQDTSGSNRFAPPQPYVYPAGSVVNATQPGAACPQQKQPLPDFPLFDNVTAISEDCLTLRVDRPAHTSPADRLPVLVFIFGGGDTIGQIYDSAYDPTLLVAGAAQKAVPVIYVAMNYRVGIFGFASSPALNASDALNAGLLDQRLALWWIQDHIAAFGGDPDRVTLFGESDGATGVGLQLTAYGGQVDTVPFQRAILESGGASADTGTAWDAAGQHTAVLIDRVNCTAPTSQAELECLRRLPMRTLLHTAYAYEVTLNPMGGMDVFIPVAPSTFIPDRPTNLLKAGRFARDIDLIAGWCENDGAFFTPTDLATSADVAQSLRDSYPRLSNASIAQALQLYPLSDFANDTTGDPPVSAQFFRASQMARDQGFTCPSLLTVETNARYASHGQVANYLYALNQTAFAEVLALEGLSYYGVPHFSDIPYIFNTVTDGRLAPVATAADRQLASAMGASWASFATFGDPSHVNGTVPGWSPAFSAGNHSSPGSSTAPKLRVLGGPDARLTGRGYHEKLVQRCAFWNSDEVTAALGV
ncbi:hypothetical protein ASPCADRAFT_209264 [Aspergillus carbonarius ITEM 5010]|uniref:Carboxylesterase type B domain-containing protein n=1 Tax=Aspergillus carbonarius (strain ITEM 5010) TaxID=602072 RepID=A0A1R3RHS2_ASPC5|nr:hypothetical protein ASPCADRAFT_209264 [Aspergillus carbonarius ITEM 5010]